MFRHFIGVFAQSEHPLVLFLDDLQWADSASLALIHELLCHPDTRHLLLIGAYRDNEVSPAHPLMGVVRETEKSGVSVSRVLLGPLSCRELGELIGDALNLRPEDVAPLAEIVHEKTGGNPFFAIQFLETLQEDRLINLDMGYWQWDIAKIRAKGFTDNVADLMAGKLKRLSASTQQTMMQLACLGTSAELRT